MAEWVTASTPYLSPRADGQADPWAREAADAGHVGRSKVVSAGDAIPSDLVAALLDIEPGSRAVRRRRIVTLDDRPVEIADSWYPTAIADGTGLAGPEPIKGGALRLLADLGYSAVRHTEDVSVISLDGESAGLLALPVGEAALELVRTSFTENGTPFEVAVMVMTKEMEPGMTRRLRYELRSG